MLLIPAKILEKLTERLFRQRKPPSEEIEESVLDKMEAPSYRKAQAQVGVDESPRAASVLPDAYIETIALKWPLKVSAMVDTDYSETARPSDGAFMPRGVRKFGDDRVETESQIKGLLEETDVLYIPPFEMVPVVKPVMQDEDLTGVDILSARGIYIGFRPREYAAAELLRDEPKPANRKLDKLEAVPEQEVASLPKSEKPEPPEAPVKPKDPTGELLYGGLFEPEKLPEHKDMYDISDAEVDRRTLISAFRKKL